MQMSFLGCIGYLMKGSGLLESLEIVYGANTVNHILSGTAYSGALLRGHFLMNTKSLNAVIISKAFDIIPFVSEEHNELLECETVQDDVTDCSDDNMQVDDTSSQSFKVLSSTEPFSTKE